MMFVKELHDAKSAFVDVKVNISFGDSCLFADFPELHPDSSCVLLSYASRGI